MTDHNGMAIGETRMPQSPSAGGLVRSPARGAATGVSFERLLERSPDLNCLVDGSGCFVWLGAAWERVLGYPREAMLGQSILGFVHPDDLVRTEAEYRRFRILGVLADFRNRYRAQDGSYRWLSWSLSADPGQEVALAVARDVTEYKVAAEHLEGLAALAVSSQDAIYSEDRAGFITGWNRAAESLYGYRAEEALGWSSSMLLSAAGAVADQAVIDRARSDQAVDHRETTRVRKDGREVEVSMSASPIHGRDGQVVGISVIARDISKEKRAEKRLRASEAKYRQIVESVNDGIWSIDTSGTTTFVNARMAAMLGYTVAEMAAQPVGELMDQEGRTIVAGVEHQDPASTELYDIEFVRRDGTTVWTLFSTSPIRALDGTYAGALAIVTDNSARRAASIALRASERQRQAILDQAAAAIHIKDLDHRYVLVNRTLAGMLGRSAFEIVGKTPADILPPDSAAQIRALDREVLERGEMVSYEELETITGQDRTFLALKFPLRDEDGTIYGLCGISTDITERKHAEDALVRANEELERRVVVRTHELETANQYLEGFSYSVSHDLRAPLRTVTGFAALLEAAAGDDLDADARRYLSLITRGAHEMLGLIEDLLSFARTGRQELVKQLVDPEVIARAALERLRAGTDGAAVDTVVFAPMPRCMADPTLLRLVFENLLSNALKFSRGRPDARIEVGFREPDGSDSGGYFVRDNGVGFDPRYTHKLFGIFQRLHRAEEFEGNGVGLVIVERIITRHGGRIRAESTLGQGAAFSFTLDGGPTGD